MGTFNFQAIANRIRIVLRAREWSERELSRQAKHSETQVNWTLKALEATPHGVPLSTLLDIADGGDVSALWLIFGIGPMDQLPPDPYPEREAAAAFARANGVR